MTIRYVYSGAGGSNDGTSWANAFTTLAGAAAVDTAGDIIYVSESHSESTAAAVSLSWAGTAADPTRIICADDSTGEPPTAVATTAVVATTGTTSTLTVVAAGTAYVYGITFKCGDGTGQSNLAANIATSGRSRFSSCTFELVNTNSSSRINLASSSSNSSEFDSCIFKFANTSQGLAISGSATIQGGSITGSAITTLFATAASQGVYYIQSFDASGGAAAMNIFASTTTGQIAYVVNTKLPASWSGSINSSTPGAGSEFVLNNSDSADTNYRLQKKTQFGTVTQDTSIYLTGGASDGTTAISWKIVSTADAEWMHQTVDSPQIVRWNESTGSALTVTCEFLIDSATTLNNNDVWMEVMYLGTSGVPLGSIDIDSRCATYLTTAAECTTGAGTGAWTGEGGSAKSYKLVSTITPQEKGFIHAVVRLAKASTTIYVDPKLTVA